MRRALTAEIACFIASTKASRVRASALRRRLLLLAKASDQDRRYTSSPSSLSPVSHRCTERLMICLALWRLCIHE